MTLRAEDMIAAIRYMLQLSEGEGEVEVDDIDISETAGCGRSMNSPVMNSARASSSSAVPCRSG